MYEKQKKKAPYINNLSLDIGLRSVNMYWLTTVDIERKTNVKLITKGRSFSVEKTSVIKKPIDWRSDAWQSENNPAKRRNGHTERSLNESLDLIFLDIFWLIVLGKVTRIPMAAIPPQNAKI